MLCPFFNNYYYTQQPAPILFRTPLTVSLLITGAQCPGLLWFLCPPWPLLVQVPCSKIGQMILFPFEMYYCAVCIRVRCVWSVDCCSKSDGVIGDVWGLACDLAVWVKLPVAWEGLIPQLLCTSGGLGSPPVSVWLNVQCGFLTGASLSPDRFH